ncbi:acyltransferase [Parasphingorhabdus sp.]|uniref:acyltransferase n=1 Tax=Parasphingorhabdus sp. TaxID=2709688 RepID=UPI003A8CEB8F
MPRDFSNESVANFLIRAFRAGTLRLRGNIYYFSGFFAKGSSRKIGFSSSGKFVNSKRIFFSRNVSFGRAPRIECYLNPETNVTGTIIFGQNTSFGDYFHAGSIEKISVGANVLGGSNILLVDHNHGSPSKDIALKNGTPPRDRPLTTKGPIIISDNVWIGDSVIILGGVTIGEGAIIAANTTVRADVPPHTIFSALKK